MHRRKQFLVYPPNYQPLAVGGGSRYRIYRSKRQAFKQAVRWGKGATVMDSIHVHPKARSSWQSSFSTRYWEMT